jgi:hypothetical protein
MAHVVSTECAFPGDVLQYFHHVHQETDPPEVHHCGGAHVLIDPAVDYVIDHCSCGLHAIDKRVAIGHDEFHQQRTVCFSGRCKGDYVGRWHVESGEVV